MRCKKPLKKDWQDLSTFPNFSATGSIKGMKNRYYGEDALLIKQGAFIYCVNQETYNASRG